MAAFLPVKLMEGAYRQPSRLAGLQGGIKCPAGAIFVHCCFIYRASDLGQIQFNQLLAFCMRRTYKSLRCHELSGLGSVSRPAVVFSLLCFIAPLAGCATVSVYEPTEAEVSLTEDQSILRTAAEAYCREARAKGLATGEASLTALADMLTGKNSNENAYWRKIGADKSAPASVVSRVRADMNLSAKGLTDLETMARALLGSSKPSKSDVSEFEKALIHARQARDSFSDALAQVNKRSDREYQITLELTPLDEALDKARETADELAATRTENAQATGA